MLVAFVIILVLLVTTVLIHLEGLWYIRRKMDRFLGSPRIALTAVVLLSLGLHVVEIALYAMAYIVADRFFHIGQFSDEAHLDIMAYFYYSAVTFTAVGYGDILPSGDIRLLAVAEPLNGLTLISWSGAYTFLAMQRFWDNRTETIAVARQKKVRRPAKQHVEAGTAIDGASKTVRTDRSVV